MSISKWSIMGPRLQQPQRRARKNSLYPERFHYLIWIPEKWHHSIYYNLAMSPLRFSSSLLTNNLNDMDNTLLRALGYPSIDTSKTNASLPENNNYEINHNRKRSISTGSDYPVKKTKESAEPSNHRPVTRSDAKYRIL